MIRKRLMRSHGQGTIEYVLIIALVAIVVLFILIALGTQVSTLYSRIVMAMP